MSWVKNVSRDVDYVVTGAADNMVKAWTWYVTVTVASSEVVVHSNRGTA